MAPRTRRAAAAANAGGGVLASLSRNVPAVKRGNNKGVVSKQQGDENIKDDKLDDSLVRTPPPFKSIVVERSQMDCSPLTLPTLPKQVKKKSFVETFHDDESSSQESEDDEDDTVSTDSSPPVNIDKKTVKRRYIAESSDEETAEMDEADQNEDPDESELADTSDPDELSEDLQTDSEESGNSSQSEVDDEDSDASEEEDDDEYVPDEEEEENASSDEDLSDYVEEERKESKKQGPTGSISDRNSKSTQPKTQESNTYAEGDYVDVFTPGDNPQHKTKSRSETLDYHALHNAVEEYSCSKNDNYDNTKPSQTPEVLMPNIGALTLEESIEENDSAMDDEEDGDGGEVPV